MSLFKEKVKDLQKAIMSHHQGSNSFCVLNGKATEVQPKVCNRSPSFEKVSNYKRSFCLLILIQMLTLLFCDAGKNTHLSGERGELCCELRLVDPTKPQEFLEFSLNFSI